MEKHNTPDKIQLLQKVRTPLLHKPLYSTIIVNIVYLFFKDNPIHTKVRPIKILCTEIPLAEKHKFVTTQTNLRKPVSRYIFRTFLDFMESKHTKPVLNIVYNRSKNNRKDCYVNPFFFYGFLLLNRDEIEANLIKTYARTGDMAINRYTEMFNRKLNTNSILKRKRTRVGNITTYKTAKIAKQNLWLLAETLDDKPEFDWIRYRIEDIADSIYIHP